MGLHSKHCPEMICAGSMSKISGQKLLGFENLKQQPISDDTQVRQQSSCLITHTKAKQQQQHSRLIVDTKAAKQQQDGRVSTHTRARQEQEQDKLPGLSMSFSCHLILVEQEASKEQEYHDGKAAEQVGHPHRAGSRPNGLAHGRGCNVAGHQDACTFNQPKPDAGCLCQTVQAHV